MTWRRPPRRTTAADVREALIKMRPRPRFVVPSKPRLPVAEPAPTIDEVNNLDMLDPEIGE